MPPGPESSDGQSDTARDVLQRLPSGTRNAVHHRKFLLSEDESPTRAKGQVLARVVQGIRAVAASEPIYEGLGKVATTAAPVRGLRESRS